MNPIKRIATIHDITGVGRVAMGVALPVISATGVQCCPIVTCVLSSHLGGDYGRTSFADLTDTFKDSFEHYKRLDYKFDLIYTGFFSSVEQIETGIEFINYYKDIPAVVDPVMGDDGKAYDTYTADRIEATKNLVKVAKIITPNVTEAGLLLGRTIPEILSLAQAAQLLEDLVKMGPEKAIVTSLPVLINNKKEYLNVGYNSLKNKFYYVKCDYVYDENGRPISFPGTGDIFVSILSSSLLSGFGVARSMEKATKFLDLVIHKTHSSGAEIREGILFEPELSWLSQNHHFNDYKEFNR